MVAKPNRIAEARKAIQQALAELVKEYEGSRVRIEENEWGHLDVTVGSDRFRNIRDDDRHDLVWKHLRTSLDPSDFGQLSEISVLDRDEYQRVFEIERWLARHERYPQDFPL